MSSHVAYGTPLQPAETRNDRVGRFHGAFTGGFSAGYNDTVGSKEGWQPSTFSASRARSSAGSGSDGDKQPGAESYMDEEDLADFEQKITLKPKFDAFVVVNREPTTSGTADTATTDAIVSRTLTPMADNVGFRILRKMGWKDGQGIGPPVVRAPIVPSKEHPLHEFAPKDVTVGAIRSADASKSVGLDSAAIRERKTPANSLSASAAAATKKRRRIQMTLSFDKDESEESDDDGERGGSLFAKRSRGQLSELAPKFIPRAYHTKAITAAATAAIRTADGLRPLEGFVLLVDDPVDRGPVFQPIRVPQGFIPGRNKAIADSTSKGVSGPSGPSNRSRLGASSRSRILNEPELPGKSIFDYISAQSRDQIARDSGSNDLPEGKARPNSANSAIDVDSIPVVDTTVARAALSANVPYTDGPKRQRYLEFLRYQAEEADNLKPQPSTDPVQWKNELSEFAQTAAMFKPLQGELANRFTRAAEPGTGESQGPHGPLKLPQLDAALAEQFGPLTRIVEPFVPQKLLAKRLSLPWHSQGKDSESEKPDKEPVRSESVAGSSQSTPSIQAAPATSSPANFLSQKKAPTELFKLVFGDEDKDDEL